MNAADRALAKGFSTLQATAGDVVIFRGQTLSAVVNWTPFEDKPMVPGVPDFNPRESSRFQFPMLAVRTAPKAGEYIKTGSVQHRIQSVSSNGSEWILDCEVER